MQRDQQINTAEALSAIDVGKSLLLGRERVEILNDVRMKVYHGEFVAIVGPSGSGKSTLLGIIAGLDTPTSGQVFIDGIDVTHMREAQLGRRPQPEDRYGLSGVQPHPDADRAGKCRVAAGHWQAFRRRDEPGEGDADAGGLAHRFKNRPNQLSGGEQQRVAIARALVTRPAIVIMDEPTGNLDRANSENVLQMIREVQRETGTTFIIATHDAAVAEAAQRTIRLLDGTVAA